MELISHSDSEKARKASEAMFGMKKIVIADLEKAVAE
jgi:hypothetical protein